MSLSSIKRHEMIQHLERLHRLTFENKYEGIPILENNNLIGSITYNDDEKKIDITFRGSVGSIWELATCLNIKKQPLEGYIHLAGSVHSGIFESFIKIYQAVLEKIKELPDQAEISIAGYSRGAAIAILMRAFLQEQLPNRKISLFTYNPMKIFDETAAKNYEEKFASLCTHLICQEDTFTNISSFGFVASPGKQLAFSAKQLPLYAQRVEKQDYPHLMGGIIGGIAKKILSAASWNAHMIETGIEAANVLELC